jgi:hypothetical protein
MFVRLLCMPAFWMLVAAIGIVGLCIFANIQWQYAKQHAQEEASMEPYRPSGLARRATEWHKRLGDGPFDDTTKTLVVIVAQYVSNGRKLEDMPGWNQDCLHTLQTALYDLDHRGPDLIPVPSPTPSESSNYALREYEQRYPKTDWGTYFQEKDREIEARIAAERKQLDKFQ